MRIITPELREIVREYCDICYTNMEIRYASTDEEDSSPKRYHKPKIPTMEGFELWLDDQDMKHLLSDELKEYAYKKFKDISINHFVTGRSHQNIAATILSEYGVGQISKQELNINALVQFVEDIPTVSTLKVDRLAELREVNQMIGEKEANKYG